jgi:methylmalonyl-CoA mutase
MSNEGCATIEEGKLVNAPVEVYKPHNAIRLVTATSLFDGHDAAINIMRRIIQDTGAEVIHLGHNRSVQEIVDAAIEEDVQGVAVPLPGGTSSFKYLIDPAARTRSGACQGVRRRRRRDCSGGSGAGGLWGAKIYSLEDGARMGLQG